MNGWMNGQTQLQMQAVLACVMCLIAIILIGNCEAGHGVLGPCFYGTWNFPIIEAVILSQTIAMGSPSRIS